MYDPIDPNQKWGAHIEIVCSNHPNMSFHTKNIGWIGARSIFPNQDEDCCCPTSALVLPTHSKE